MNSLPPVINATAIVTENVILATAAVESTVIRATATVVHGLKGNPGNDGTTGQNKYEQLTGVPNGILKAFQTSSLLIAGSETVFINGLAQLAFTHYTVSGQTITFDDPPEIGDILTISYSYT